MVKYRRRIDIIADILSSTSSGAAKKTWIMYAANLSHSLVEKYLAEVVKLGLLRSNNNMYEITERGIIFLKRYRCFMSKYSEVQQSLKATLSEMRELEDMCSLPAGVRNSRRERR